jgi:hypothetical protein
MYRRDLAALFGMLRLFCVFSRPEDTAQHARDPASVSCCTRCCMCACPARRFRVMQVVWTMFLCSFTLVTTLRSALRDFTGDDATFSLTFTTIATSSYVLWLAALQVHMIRYFRTSYSLVRAVFTDWLRHAYARPDAVMRRFRCGYWAYAVLMWGLIACSVTATFVLGHETGSNGFFVAYTLAKILLYFWLSSIMVVVSLVFFAQCDLYDQHVCHMLEQMKTRRFDTVQSFLRLYFSIARPIHHWSKRWQTVLAGFFVSGVFLTVAMFLLLYQRSFGMADNSSSLIVSLHFVIIAVNGGIFVIFFVSVGARIAVLNSRQMRIERTLTLQRMFSSVQRSAIVSDLRRLPVRFTVFNFPFSFETLVKISVAGMAALSPLVIKELIKSAS